MATLLVILLVIVAVAVIQVLVRLKLVVVPVLVALLLASAIHPFVDYLHRRGVPKLAAVWIALLAGLAVIGGLGTAVIYSVYSQWGSLTVSSDIGFGRLERNLASTALPFTEEEIRQVRESTIQSIGDSLSVGDALGGLSVLANLVTALILLVIVLFFFLKDGRNMWIFLIRPLTGTTLLKALRAGDRAVNTMGAYLRGTAVIATIDAAGIGLAMVFIGVPLALPLTMIVFLGGFIPVIGATVTGIFAVLVAYVTNGAGSALALAVAVVVVQQLEGNLLQPVIMGKAVKLHPLVILLALGIGALLAGVIGALLAVPVTAVAWTVMKAWRENPNQGAHAIEST